MWEVAKQILRVIVPMLVQTRMEKLAARIGAAIKKIRKEDKDGR